MLTAIDSQLRNLSTAGSSDWTALPVLLDLKASPLASPEAFFSLLLDKLHSQVDVTARQRPPNAWPSPVRLDAGWFEQLLKKSAISIHEFEDALGYTLDKLDTLGQPVRLILLLDEFNETLGKLWTDQLYNQLRSLVYSGKVKDRIRLVPAGSESLLEHVNEPGSPFSGKLILKYLEVFDKSGFRELCGRAEGLPDEVSAAIWNQSKGHPFLAQYLLYHLWERGVSTASAEDVDTQAARFRHERYNDLEGWAHALDVAGLRAYGVLSVTSDWIEEIDIFRAVDDSRLNINLGLLRLCCHGLAIHDEGWMHYMRTGDLFKSWFDENGKDFIAELEATGRPRVKSNAPDQRKEPEPNEQGRSIPPIIIYGLFGIFRGCLRNQ